MWNLEPFLFDSSNGLSLIVFSLFVSLLYYLLQDHYILQTFNRFYMKGEYTVGKCVNLDVKKQWCGSIHGCFTVEHLHVDYCIKSFMLNMFECIFIANRNVMLDELPGLLKQL